MGTRLSKITTDLKKKGEADAGSNSPRVGKKRDAEEENMIADLQEQLRQSQKKNEKMSNQV